MNIIKTCRLIVKFVKKNTKNLDWKMWRTKNGRPFLSSKCAACGVFVKEQEAIQLLSSLRIKRPLSKVPLLGDILL